MTHYAANRTIVEQEWHVELTGDFIKLGRFPSLAVHCDLRFLSQKKDFSVFNVSFIIKMFTVARHYV